MSSKKRKISGLSGLELDLALTQLRKLRSSVIVEEVPESDPAPADTFTDQLDSMIATLESRTNSPLSLSFSAADDTALERFNIVRKGLLYLHPEDTLRDAIITSRIVGSDKLWSNDNMYKHLAFLASSFTDKNETSSRMVIDTFFFRSTAMVPPPQKVIVMLENQISTVYPRLSKMDTISGIVDYTAVVANSTIAENYIRIPPTLNQRYGGEMIAFFAAEAKASTIAVPLEGHLPQVLLELVACAKHLGKSHIRGALTTGIKWHFIVVDLDADGDGAEYWVSELIEWKTKRSSTSRERLVEGTSDEFDPALIAGILSSWIPESFAEFIGDKWFFQQPGGGGV
ncbi:hypothetical protein JOM56_006965 [Amanita muscaria]